jgi:hypothetical protein
MVGHRLQPQPPTTDPDADFDSPRSSNSCSAISEASSGKSTGNPGASGRSF